MEKESLSKFQDFFLEKLQKGLEGPGWQKKNSLLENLTSLANILLEIA